MTAGIQTNLQVSDIELDVVRLIVSGRYAQERAVQRFSPSQVFYGNDDCSRTPLLPHLVLVRHCSDGWRRKKVPVDCHVGYDWTRAEDVIVDEHDWLADRFEENRTHLRAVAYRMLGSLSDADDAVQESWLRLSRSDTSDVKNMSGWLTTVVARVCLDMLRSRKSRREEPLEAPTHDSIESRADGVDPEHEAVLADSVGLALLVVLETLAPAERLAFVLHDMFAVPFDEIAPIVGRSPTAAKMLASRARRRVQDKATAPNTDVAPHRAVVDAFLAASRHGEFDALLALLDPQVVLRADPAAVQSGASNEVRGARAVAEQFSGRARAAQPALVNGAAGAVWAPGGQPRVVFNFTITGGKIVAIDILADLSQLDLVVLKD